MIAMWTTNIKEPHGSPKDRNLGQASSRLSYYPEDDTKPHLDIIVDYT